MHQTLKLHISIVYILAAIKLASSFSVRFNNQVTSLGFSPFHLYAHARICPWHPEGAATALRPVIALAVAASAAREPAASHSMAVSSFSVLEPNAQRSSFHIEELDPLF